RLRGGGLVVAGVVREPGDGRVRELLVLDPVAAGQLDRVHRQPGGQLIHDPLDDEGRLRPPGAAVGVGRRLVGEDALAGERVRLELIDARVHVATQQRDARRQQLQVAAHVGGEVDLQAQDATVSGGGELDVLDDVAAVDGGLVVLAARLGPLDRLAELTGDDEGDDLLGVDVQLGAETAAHIGGDHPDLVFRHAGVQGDEDPDEVGNLRGGPDGRLPGGRGRGDRD